MLVSGGSRQLVIRLKKYSDKKNNAVRRQHNRSKVNLNESPKDDPEALNMNVETSSSEMTEVVEDRSLLGRLLNCAPCKQVTEDHQAKIVRLSHSNAPPSSFARLGHQQTELGR